MKEDIRNKCFCKIVRQIDIRDTPSAACFIKLQKI